VNRRNSRLQLVIILAGIVALICLALTIIGCGASPTEPAALRVAGGDPVFRTPTPTPCFPNPWTDCGAPRPTPTPGVAPTSTPPAWIPTWPAGAPTPTYAPWPTGVPTPPPQDGP
jgi:hypothetical protein